MSQPHELILLSPYRYPGQYALTLADEDMASWLNAYTTLWHPGLLFGAKEPPRVEQPYDHENPKPGCVYVLPETPTVYLPDDWQNRVKDAGSIAYTALPDRTATLENLRRLLSEPDAPALGMKEAFEELPADLLSLFFGVGMGYLLQATLAEAMEHENLLDAAGFWDDVQGSIRAMLAPEQPEPPTPSSDELALTEPLPSPEPENVAGAESHAPAPNPTMPSETARAVADSEDLPIEVPPGAIDAPDPDSMPFQPRTEEPTPQPADAPAVPDWLKCLQSAAMKLLTAREVLYPVNIHLLDLHLLDAARLEAGWPSALELGCTTNVLACSSTLEKLAKDQPLKFEQLKTQLKADLVEVVGGLFTERADHLLPWDSQIWNLEHGLSESKRLLQSDIRVFARRDFGWHPQTPLMLSTHGVTRFLFLIFDEDAGLPSFSSTVVSWTSPDGKEVYAYVRPGKPAASVETFFNLGHYWFKTTREDHTATLFLVHKGEDELPWYRDILALSRLSTVLGTWTTFSKYFNEVMPGEYPTPLAADDLHHDQLSRRHEAKLDDPVSAYARHLRLRRRIDGCWTFAALYRALSGTKDNLGVQDHLVSIENVFESQPRLGTEPGGLEELEKSIAASLAERLQARAREDEPGYMLLNPCGFARRIALELDGAKHPILVEGPVKACQLDGAQMRVVVEVPAFGFAWIAKEGKPGTPPMTARIKLGDPKFNTIRNEFFEAEVDPVTGGLKAIRDHKSRVNRLGQQLVFNPGSRMLARTVEVTSTGPALGEIVSVGDIVGPQDQVLAAFRQRLRLWLGRPLLEMRIEITPVQPAVGYPWHAYFGSRFAWRDERTLLVRSIHGTRHISSHPRPQTAEYIDLRLAQFGTTLFTGGLPFHQKQEGRMLDVILVPEGEKTTTFDLGISLDRDVPSLTALGLTSPLAVVPTVKGPPHIGASGWLFHIDMPNLLISRLLPGKREIRAEDNPPTGEPEDAITAQILECTGNSGHAEFRCVRNPKRAVLLSGNGHFLTDAGINGDAVFLEVSPSDWVQLQVEF
jgi:hypothetical protein